MCGIFGVHGHGDAVHLTQLGLYALQHRGQESVGVAVFNEQGAARVVRSGAFRHVIPVQSRGNAAIVQALDQAMDAAFIEIANWALG